MCALLTQAGTAVEALAERLTKAGEDVNTREGVLNGMLEAESAKDGLKKQFAEAASWLHAFTSEQARLLTNRRTCDY